MSEKIKRARYLFFHYQEKPVIDMERFLQGEAEILTNTQVRVASVLTTEEYVFSEQEFTLISAIPQYLWTEKDEIIKQQHTSDAVIEDLLEKGILISDGDSERKTQLREKEKRLAQTRWYRYSMLYHYMSKWDGGRFQQALQDSSGQDDQQEAVPEVAAEDPSIDELIKARGGLPPHHFFSLDRHQGVVELPLDDDRDAFIDQILLNRRTIREFDQNKPLNFELYSKILYYVFGCHGTLPFEGHKDISIVKKTSPSGGSMHPIDAYPVVTHVDGLEPGIYHYNMQHHQLEIIKTMTRQQAIDLVTTCTAGQDYFGSAHVSTILMARFYRNFWKYAYHKKAYKVILMDGAHLSQTHYMLCAHLGLGAYYTAAIDDVAIEDTFGLDGCEHGVVGVCGCGIPVAKLDPDLNFMPTAYHPKHSS